MDWDDLRHFAGFVEAGSLAGAARVLGIEHATVARRIAALEARLRLKLVDRRGRRLVLTPDGERVADLAKGVATEMRRLERLAEGARSELAGTVTISAPSAYAGAVLAPKLARLRQRHPGLALRLLGEARTASLDRREADIGIRLSRPEAGDLTAIKLGEMAFRLYAAPAYLAAVPEADWRFIGSEGAMAGSPQQTALEGIAGDRPFGLRSDHVEIQVALAAAGGGIAILPDFMTENDPRLVPVPPDRPALRRGIWLVVHSDMRNAPAIRAVIDGLRYGAAE
ncbi:LysR family transcriptional regulator [Aureimonas endophytica]|uniref:LysR family transcriptional regulator n=1 Tax=Aureimonas endophytica TaxID=2027858 RepID=A0A917E960_9HYPH|nr:LysR family transcriptional regulator [Aureimonas endophytica]GGE16174.1 LysR family transcriptional regulator [Aureimonas endophytica]